ncbi:Maf family protein [Ilumatobacter sp.]|uniref:Maf family protein n=1 Tax=Ilumatobacter sp. TaxID=1967498 RepID=UPI003B5203C4
MITVPEAVTVVLASRSPRRRDLLASIGLEFEVRPADVDETPRPVEDPADYVRRLSLDKSGAVRADVVIAADTTVDVDGRILGKPDDDDDVRRMLRTLSGRTHRVRTGVTVVGPSASVTEVVTTQVTFVELRAEAIDWYVRCGEGRDKAGAYGIQGAAAAFVAAVDGSVSNVVGLPLAETVAMLRTVLGAD